MVVVFPILIHAVGLATRDVIGDMRQPTEIIIERKDIAVMILFYAALAVMYVFLLRGIIRYFNL